MQSFVTTNPLALILLFVLLLSGSVGALRNFAGLYIKRRHFVIFEISEDRVRNLKDVLDLANPPFTFEVAVSQLGKARMFYLTLPAGKAGKVAREAGVKRIDDYDLYYPGGVVVGAYASGEGSVSELKVEKINFSEVNEIGEGAVVQFVVKQRNKNGLVANLRTLISAPSSYQAKEIFSGIKASLGNVKLTEVRSGEFIDRVNARAFSDKEVITLLV